MSKYSAIAEWEVHYGDMASYFYYNLRHPEKNLVFSMNASRLENLNSIIHEINECEVMFALRDIGIKDIDIHVTKTMCRKYPWLFKKPAKHIIITHILSPYGQKNCILSRKKNRVNW